jgi:hypothetical protein
MEMKTVTEFSKAEALFRARQESDQRVKAQEEARLKGLREKTARLRALRLAGNSAQAGLSECD